MAVSWGRRIEYTKRRGDIRLWGEEATRGHGPCGASVFSGVLGGLSDPGPGYAAPIFGTALAFRAETERLLVHRHGMLEEAYFTFSISPLLDDDGTVLGILNTYVETTARVLGERRMATLRRLAERAVHARRPSEACSEAIRRSGESVRPPPLSCFTSRSMRYFPKPRRGHGRRRGRPAAPRSLGPHTPSDAFAWPFEKVLQSRKAVVVEDLFSKVDLGAWPRRTSKPRDALVLPLVLFADALLPGFWLLG